MNQIIYPVILHEGTPLHLVPHYPDNGYRFYVAHDGRINGEMCGIRIAPNGVQALMKANTTTWPNSADKSNANRKQRYWHFKHAWGQNKGILVSHAVYLAWSGESIPLYHQIHHLNGITIDNCVDNLLCVHFREHRLVSDVRQKALRTVVPDKDLTIFPYDRLRQLQDPRVLTDEQFAEELESIRAQGYHRVDPLAAASKGIIVPDAGKEPNRDFDPFVEHD